MRQLRLADFRRVVDKNGAARGNADPAPMLRTVLRRNLLQGGGIQRGEKFGIIDQHHRRRVLGQKHIGRRRGAFLNQLITQLTVIAIAQRDLNTGLFGESIHPRLHQIFVLGVVNHNPVLSVSRHPLRRQKQRSGNQRCRTEGR